MSANKGVLEFLTVAAEFCAFVEKAEQISKRDFIEKSQKILSLIYLKASLLKQETEIEGYCDQYVTEDDWNFVKDAITAKLGSHETFLEIIEPDNYSNSETVSVSISECFADMYQDLRDFIERYKDGNDEAREIAIFECILQFKMYWGARLLAVLTEFHSLLYASNSSIEHED